VLLLAACDSSSNVTDRVDAPEGEAVLVVNPQSIDFGDVGAGVSTSPFVTVTITNKGSLTSGLVSSQITFTDAALFRIIGNGCPLVAIPPLGECVMQVQFRPDTPTGAKQARLLIGAIPGGELVIPLTGNAVVDTSPKLVPNQASANFGIRALGTTSPVFDIVIRNTGVAATGPISVNLQAPPGVFGVNTNCSAALPPNGTCTLGVTYRPSAAAIEQGDITLSANPGGTTTLHLQGQGANISFNTTPSSRDFGNVIAGNQSITQTINLLNTGSATIIPQTSITGAGANNFMFAFDGCGGSAINPGTGCTMDLRFQPQSIGAKTANLRIDANGSVGTVALTGLGISEEAAHLAASPLSVFFGDETVGATTAARSITITNTGGTTTDTISIARSGAGAAAFATTHDCTTLAPNATCTVMATFSPQATGTVSATLTVSAGTAAPAMVMISGNGI